MDFADRELGRVKFLNDWPASKKLQRNHYILSSYVGSYAKMSQPTFLGVGAGESLLERIELNLCLWTQTLILCLCQ